DTVGLSIWRASWQAAVLAVLVALLLRSCGERLAPRWRFLLWGVVLIRLVCLAIPVSPWSVFNLVPRNSPEPGAMPVAHRVADAMLAPAAHMPGTSGDAVDTVPLSPRDPESAPRSHVVETPTASGMPSPSSRALPASTPSVSVFFNAAFVTRLLSSIWLTGC